MGNLSSIYAQIIAKGFSFLVMQEYSMCLLFSLYNLKTNFLPKVTLPNTVHSHNAFFCTCCNLQSLSPSNCSSVNPPLSLFSSKPFSFLFLQKKFHTTYHTTDLAGVLSHCEILILLHPYESSFAVTPGHCCSKNTVCRTCRPPCPGRHWGFRQAWLQPHGCFLSSARRSPVAVPQGRRPCRESGTPR